MIFELNHAVTVYSRIPYKNWVQIICETRHNNLDGGVVKKKVMSIEEGILEAKTDCSAKDLLLLASFAFCVINFEPIII
jgi:hypothetical protein